MVQFLVEDQPPIAMRAVGLLADGGSKVFEARTMSDALTVVVGEYAIISLTPTSISSTAGPNFRI
jgi:hypothetical protein